MVSNNRGLIYKSAYVIICVLIYVIISVLGYSDKGLIIAFSFASIALAASSKWNCRGRVWFWFLVIGWSALHLAVAIEINGSIRLHPTILLAPVVIIDFLIVLSSFFLVERAVGESGSAR